MCDLVSLYTNIPQELSLRALLYYITKYRYLIPIRFSKEFILEAPEFVLKNNNFILLEEMLNQVMAPQWVQNLHHHMSIFLLDS